MKFKIVSNKNVEETKAETPWFETKTIKKHNIKFDTNTMLTANDFF